VNCSGNVEFSSEFQEKTTGKYLFDYDEVIEVFYENNQLFLKWRGAEKIQPVVLKDSSFFIADMYQKLKFVTKKTTNERYLTVVNPEDESIITYDYLKLKESEDIPSAYLKNGDYARALDGYLNIQSEDPDSRFIREYDFNRMGYRQLNKGNYDMAIGIFKINTKLYPESSNVFDSLADAYARSGDTLNAIINYQKALEINSENKRAEKFIATYQKDSLK
ncbi:MAG: tetratricopeptide repeat protein, partial [bacterium]